MLVSDFFLTIALNQINDAVKLLLAEGMCIRVDEHWGSTRIECSAPILGAMMLAAICGPIFEIPASELPENRGSLDMYWLLKYTIEVGFYSQNFITIQV